jgi:outer membrane protein
MTSRRIILAVAALFFSGCFAASAFAASQSKIGYFDLTEVIAKSEAGKALDKEMSSEVESVKKDVKKYEDEFDKKRSEFESKNLLWDEKVRKEKLRELAMMERQLAERRRAAELRLRQVQRKLTSPLLRDIQNIVEGIGKRGGYTIVFERAQAGIFYAPGAFDLTDRVIKEFNDSYEKKRRRRKR